jgi:hypothetical protein
MIHPGPLLQRVPLLSRLARFRRLLGRALASPGPYSPPGEVLWVETDRITETALNYLREFPSGTLGKVRGGNWDLAREKVSDLRVVRFLTKHFVEGVDLRDTDFYNPHITTAEQARSCRGHSWDFITAYEYEARMQRIRSACDSIRTEGYRTSRERGGDPLDEILVKIGRNGEFLFMNSVHRLALARILKVPKVPVIVAVRHREWVESKKRLVRSATQRTDLFRRKVCLDRKPAHPDLAGIPCARDGEA